MKLVTRDTDYAIRALCVIAKKKNGLASVSELAEQTKTPKPFLRKILQALNKTELVKSYKGKGGGFELNIPADKIVLPDIMSVFQGQFELNEHVFKSKACPNTKKCRLKKRLDVIEKYIIKELEKITLDSLMAKG